MKGLFTNEVKDSDNSTWYTENFISNSIIEHLANNGYKIHKDDVAKRFGSGEKVIVASKFFTKEIIEVKGLLVESSRSKLLNEAAEKINPARAGKNSLSETLLNSLINFGRYYSDENATVAMALP